MAEVMPLSRSLTTTAPLFTAQPAMRLSAPLAGTPRPPAREAPSRASNPADGGGALVGIANPSLSSIEVESLLRESIRSKYASLQQAFKAYDTVARGTVTKGEFRRILEGSCVPLTSEQFESIVAKADLSQDGTVKYVQFIEKFLGKRPRADSEPQASSYKFVQPNWPSTPQQPVETNIDTIEKILVEKIRKSPKDFVRSFHLYDYNRDGMIQKHDFRKVLDSNSLKLSDQQFDRLWMRQDYHHSGVMDYREYLRKMGVSTGRPSDVTTERLESPGTGLGVFPGAARRGDALQSRAPSFDELDREFRRKMVSNYLNLKKAFIACDRHRDGFIELGELRAVLSAFTIPMSDQLFSRLMEKAEIKASGKVSWEHVLNKFQDAQSSGNGQTVPIKPGHKFFPLREADEPASADELWRLLYKHVNSAYGSFKSAFLEIDERRTGKITKKDIAKVLGTFKLKLTNEQLSKLMKRLDPENANAIDYLAFLDIFEPRETREGHKWLKSEHRFNSRQAPVILAWETVEEILRDKITDNWKEVADRLGSYDPLGTAKINRAHLRKILTSACLPLSDDHFKSMMDRLEDNDGEKVNYVEFLAKLGVDVKPGDLVGVSTEIFNGHNKEMERRQVDKELRDASVTTAMVERTNLMSPEEVITRLRDRMMQHKTSVRQAFLHYDNEKKGKISKKTFRKVLADQGILMDDELFGKVVELLKFHRGKLDYRTFVETFDDPRESSSTSDEIKRLGNHRVNTIRGDETGMTALEVEGKLRNKLRENFEDLRGAFYKFDADHQGLLRRSDFRRMLDSFMLIISDAEFDVLCQRLGFVNKRSRLGYKDFLDKFEVRDLPEGHKWLWSEHRFNDVKASPLMTAEEAHAIIARKSHRQWRDLAKAFIAIGGTAGGSITKQQLRDLLTRFIIPLSDEEFKKLWQRYNPNGHGAISHEAFLKQLGAEFAPGDELGPSRRIYEGSYKQLDKHQMEMLIKHEEQTFNQALRTWAMPVAEIHQQLRDRIRDQHADFYKAFKKYDKQNTGYLTEDDIQRILVDFNYFVSDSQLDELLKRLGIQSKDDRVPYEQFLSGFEEGRKEQYEPASKDFKFKNYEQLSPEKAETKLQKSVVEQSAALTAVLQALDKDRSGKVKVADLRRVLDSFCFKMTDQQFKHIMNRFRVVSDGEISYSAFLEVYNDDLVQDPSFVERQVRNLKDTVPAEIEELSSAQLIARLSHRVAEKFYDLARHFAEVDYAGIGVVSKEDFRDIVFKYCFRMQPEQLENLLASLKITAHGNVDYHDFLKTYSSQPRGSSERPAAPGGQQRPPTADGGRQSAMLDGRPGTRDSLASAERELLATRGQSRAMPRVGSRAGAVTPMVNAEDIELKHGATVRRRWKEFLRHCRQLDAAGSGQIEADHFRELAEKYDFALDKAELQRLLTKYDIKNNGKFCYMHFLRHFVLSLTPRQSLDEEAEPRRAPTAPPQPITPVAASNELLEAMLRIGPAVTAGWKEMRRMFKASEEGLPGYVSPYNFRNILRQFSINLSEDEFYQMLTFYDKDMKGRVSYNDFIANSLKMAPA